jgi:branched-chain amino acid transport system permease protein
MSIAPLIRKNAPHASFIIITLAVSRLTSEGANVLSGGMMRSVKPLLGSNSLKVGGIFIPPQILGIIVIGLAIIVALWFFFNKTMAGISMNAVAINKEGAELVGINYGRVVLNSFIIAAIVGGVAGLMLGQWQHAYPHMGVGIGIKGFAALVFGGIGNWWGALAGGLAIGISEALASGYISTSYADSVALVIMLFVLWLKPEGLLPSKL